jgi:hypothetical protein
VEWCTFRGATCMEGECAEEDVVVVVAAALVKRRGFGNKLRVVKPMRDLECTSADRFQTRRTFSRSTHKVPPASTFPTSNLSPRTFLTLASSQAPGTLFPVHHTST